MWKNFKRLLSFIGTHGGNILREDGWFFVLMTLLNLPILIQAFFGAKIPFDEGLANGLPNF